MGKFTGTQHFVDSVILVCTLCPAFVRFLVDVEVIYGSVGTC